MKPLADCIFFYLLTHYSYLCIKKLCQKNALHEIKKQEYGKCVVYNYNGKQSSIAMQGYINIQICVKIYQLKCHDHQRLTNNTVEYVVDSNW